MLSLKLRTKLLWVVVGVARMATRVDFRTRIIRGRVAWGIRGRGQMLPKTVVAVKGTKEGRVVTIGTAVTQGVIA